MTTKQNPTQAILERLDESLRSLHEKTSVNTLEASSLEPLNQRILALEGTVSMLTSGMKRLENGYSESGVLELSRQLDSLKLWKADLMGMLTEKSPMTGRERLTPRGRAFKAIYGKNQ